MNRRTFIALSAATPFALQNKVYAKEIPSRVWTTLGEVFLLLFPKTSTMPSASEFKALEYLIKNIDHPSFDSDDYNLITQGVDYFLRDFPKFLKAKTAQKNAMLLKASEDAYYESWFSRLIYYGFEAMLSDPLYGGNTQQIAWNALEHPYGLPQPLKTYGQHT